MLTGGIVGFLAGSLDGAEGVAHAVKLNASTSSSSTIPMGSGGGNSCSRISSRLPMFFKRPSVDVGLCNRGLPFSSYMGFPLAVGGKVGERQQRGQG